MTPSATITVIGVGNDFRRDDGVGLFIARKIRQKAFPHVRVVEGVSDGVALINAWDDSTRVFIVDCASSGKSPGTIFCFDAISEKIPSEIVGGRSTHVFSVGDGIETARALGRLPAFLMVYGIEGDEFSQGEGLSPAVEKAALDVVAKIISQIMTP